MLHEAFKSIFADIFGFGSVPSRRPSHSVQTVTVRDEHELGAEALRNSEDPLDGVYHHEDGGVLRDIYGRPV